MARLPRRVLPETCAVHVYSRGIRRERIFLRERDGDAFLFRAALAFERNELECRTYCLMPNHFHFLLYGRRPAMSEALRWLLGGYAVWFNKQHGHRGHLFGDRYGARLLEDDLDALGVARYVLLNPVRAGLCAHPRQWKWSSYRATVGLARRPAFLSLAWLDAVMSRSAFAAYVDEGLAVDNLAA